MAVTPRFNRSCCHFHQMVTCSLSQCVSPACFGVWWFYKQTKSGKRFFSTPHQLVSSSTPGKAGDLTPTIRKCWGWNSTKQTKSERGVERDAPLAHTVGSLGGHTVDAPSTVHVPVGHTVANTASPRQLPAHTVGSLGSHTVDAPSTVHVPVGHTELRGGQHSCPVAATCSHGGHPRRPHGGRSFGCAHAGQPYQRIGA